MQECEGLQTSADYDLLAKAALDARASAYCPYSNFAVGAALLAKSGKIYRGCNIENASYPVTNCAERTALFAAVAAGEREFTAIAIAGGKNGAPPDQFTAPCGVCRQALREFNAGDLTVILVKSQSEQEIYTLEQLLPAGFGPQNLMP